MGVLPAYELHQTVRAFKIKNIIFASEGLYHLTGDPNIGVTVDTDWIMRHDPKVGGYYVIPDDEGFEYYSPAAVFEGISKRIEA